MAVVVGTIAVSVLRLADLSRARATAFLAGVQAWASVPAGSLGENQKLGRRPVRLNGSSIPRGLNSPPGTLGKLLPDSAYS